MTIDQDILDREQVALETDKALYLDCMNGKPLTDRITDEEKRNGLILFWHVYTFIKNSP